MEIQFVKVSPNENMTLLIETPIPREQQLALATKLISYGNVYAEQAGFIEPPTQPNTKARLQMMAGEFCGNGTLSLACYLFSQQQPKQGEQTQLLLEVSGSAEPILCDVWKQKKGYQCSMNMPIPNTITIQTYIVEGCRYELPTVDFGGIVHIIVDKSIWGTQYQQKAEQAAHAWQNDIQSEAFGILIWDTHTNTLESLVCVKHASLIWERGCGSGTTAIGAYLTTMSQQSMQLNIQQKGGTMQIASIYEHGDIQSLTLTVHVEIVAKGIAYI